jgi:primary-amine oxidase
MAQINAPEVEHPLDPLTAAEIELTTEILEQRDEVDGSIGFYSYQPVEPDKAEVDEWEDGDSFERRVTAVLRDFEERETYEAALDRARNRLRVAMGQVGKGA